MMFAGQVGVLNVGAGDTKLVFDNTKPQESAHAARVIEDMLKRGYAIMVQVGEKDGEPLYQRAKGFDPKTHEYIVMGTPDVSVEHTARPLSAEEVEAAKGLDAGPPLPEKPRRGRPRKLAAPAIRVPAERTRAVAVGRSAGG